MRFVAFVGADFGQPLVCYNIFLQIKWCGFLNEHLCSHDILDGHLQKVNVCLRLSSIGSRCISHKFWLQVYVWLTTVQTTVVSWQLAV